MYMPTSTSSSSTPSVTSSASSFQATSSPWSLTRGSAVAPSAHSEWHCRCLLPLGTSSDGTAWPPMSRPSSSAALQPSRSPRRRRISIRVSHVVDALTGPRSRAGGGVRKRSLRFRFSRPNSYHPSSRHLCHAVVAPVRASLVES
jgi:hypothetical protein